MGLHNSPELKQKEIRGSLWLHVATVLVLCRIYCSKKGMYKMNNSTLVNAKIEKKGWPGSEQSLLVFHLIKYQLFRYTLKKKKRRRQISKQNKTKQKRKKKGKTERKKRRIWNRHLLHHATSPYHYSTDQGWLGNVAESFKFNAFSMELPSTNAVQSLSSLWQGKNRVIDSEKTV